MAGDGNRPQCGLVAGPEFLQKKKKPSFRYQMKLFHIEVISSLPFCVNIRCVSNLLSFIATHLCEITSRGAQAAGPENMPPLTEYI